jgi:hypothetical protein
VRLGLFVCGTKKAPTIRGRGAEGGTLNPVIYIAEMCGRSTYKLTWEELVRLYRLTLN